MKENKQKNSKKRLNSLILLVAFTAIMLIVSTYAWFTTQKNVSLSNLTGIVKVAEGLEISLDAEHWSQEIDFSKYTNTELQKRYGESNHNIAPEELIPASSTGLKGLVGNISENTYTVYNEKDGENNNIQTELLLYRGTASAVENVVPNQWKLENITSVGNLTAASTSSSDLNYTGYYAIDLFLRNSGFNTEAGDVQGTTRETLQLSQGSTLAVMDGGNAATGLQNTPRVAFALYNGAADVTAGQADVLAATTGVAKGIEDVAIWEPNADAHVEAITTNFNLIKWKSSENGKYLSTGTTFEDGDIIPTYALAKTSAGKSYSDLYNWDGTTNVGLEKQIALQTPNGATATAKNLLSVVTPETCLYTIGAEGTKKEFQILKNSTIRLRMYIWLEGQDPDCVNYASHGGGIELNMGLCKGEDTTVVSGEGS